MPNNLVFYTKNTISKLFCSKLPLISTMNPIHYIFSFFSDFIYFFRNFFTFYIFVLFLLPFANKAQAQAIPTAEHYTIYDYHAHPQNWSVVQDDIGRMYVANAKGVLEYDGNRWKLIELPNLASVTALTKGEDGKIYVGAVSEVGYLDSDSLGNKIYVSLLDKIAEQDKKFSTIWKAFTTSEGIVFQSFEKIFWYKNGKFKTIAPNSAFHLAFQTKEYNKNKLFVREWGKGLHNLTSKGLEFVVGSEIFADEKIYAILPQNAATSFIVTEQKGIYTYNQNTGFLPYSSASDSILKSSQVYCGIQLADGNYAIGTRLAGILIFDANFNFLYNISSKNGLKDDRVASLYEDSNKQLWAALSNGISYIDVASSFRYFDKNTDINRNILSISPPYKESLYIGTVQGIFKSNTDKAKTIKDFKLLPYSERETWKLGVYKDVLLGAQNPGIAWIEKRGIEELLAASNPFIQDFVLIKNDTSHLIAASIEGLLLLRWQDNHWVFVDKIKGFSGAATKIIQDDNNDFWVSDYNRGVFRFQLSSDFLMIAHSEFFGKLNGLPKNQGNHVFEYNGKAIFGTLEGIYGFSENTFTPHPIFKKLIEKKAITIFEKDKKGNLWIVTQNEKNKPSGSQTLLVQLKKTDSSYQRYDAPFYKIKQIVQAVAPIDENLVLIGTNEGLISYNPLNTIADKQPFSTFITQVEYSKAKDSLLFATDFIFNQQQKPSDEQSINLPYKLNSLRFSFGSSFFEQRSEVYYKTKLERLDDSWTTDESWSAWTNKTQDKFNNLSEGDYVFHLKAKNLYGVESKEVTFKFTIETPWFKHPLFYLFLVLLVGFCVNYGIRIYIKRLQSEKNLLENTVRERTEDMRKAYFNTRVLSKLGQEITSTRSIDEITAMIYQHVSKLMDASVFGIGIHNEENETLEFPVAIENGEKLPFHSENLDDTGRFAVWCFLNEQDLFINDSEVDYELYISHRPEATVGKVAPSLIYLPLKIKKKVIGVITVQSFKKNAYDDYHLNLLRSLAVYTGIAIENANSYHQINEQKDIIEDKNKQLISSINYAKRIQNAILPPLETIQEEFEESFVLFLPRDIVSGDFYYFNKINGKSIISAIDCTGHGVPGAFMSMIGYELLNEIILAKHITNPAKILEALHEGISKGLRQEQTFTQDGMDMTLCVWDNQTNTLEIAAARNQMYLFNAEDKERIIEIGADRQSIGGKMDENFEFTSHQIQIQKNDTVYLLTDGYQDQFGGAEDRKYLRRRLKDFLQNHQHLSMTQQRRALQRELTEWKGDKHQVDDILIIGLRF